MKKLHDFKCPDGHVEERFCESNEYRGTCSCGKESRKIITGGNFMLDPISGHFPSATQKWAKYHEDAAKGEES